VTGEAYKYQVTSVELYGFMMWLFTALLSIVYTIWVFVPDQILEDLGIGYIPNKYYLLALANWLGVTYYVGHGTLYCLSMMQCHTPDSYFTMQDRHTRLNQPKHLLLRQLNTMDANQKS